MRSTATLFPKAYLNSERMGIEKVQNPILYMFAHPRAGGYAIIIIIHPYKRPIVSDEQTTYEELVNQLQRLRQQVAELEPAKRSPDVSSAGKKGASDTNESEDRYRLLVQKAHEGIIIAQKGMLRFVNPAVARIFEYSEEELLSRPVAEFVHPDDRAMVEDRSVRRASGEDVSARYDHRIVTKDGKTKWGAIDSAAISWEGKPVVLVFITDVPERRRMQEALRERESHYQAMVEESFVGKPYNMKELIQAVQDALKED